MHIDEEAIKPHLGRCFFATALGVTVALEGGGSLQKVFGVDISSDNPHDSQLVSLPTKLDNLRMIRVDWDPFAPTEEQVANQIRNCFLAIAVSEIILVPVISQAYCLSPISVFAWILPFLLQDTSTSQHRTARKVLLVVPDHDKEEAPLNTPLRQKIESLLPLDPTEPAASFITFHTVCLRHAKCQTSAAQLVSSLVNSFPQTALVTPETFLGALQRLEQCEPIPNALRLVLERRWQETSEHLLDDASAKIRELQIFSEMPAIADSFLEDATLVWDEIMKQHTTDSSFMASQLRLECIEDFEEKLSQRLEILYMDILIKAIEIYYYRFRSEAENICKNSFPAMSSLRKQADAVMADFKKNLGGVALHGHQWTVDRHLRLLENLLQKELVVHRSRQGTVMQQTIQTFLSVQLNEGVAPLLSRMSVGDLEVVWRDIRVAMAVVIQATEGEIESYAKDFEASDDEMAALRCAVQREISAWMDIRLQSILESLQNNLYSRFDRSFWGKSGRKHQTMDAFRAARAFALDLLDVFNSSPTYQLGTSYRNPVLDEASKEQIIKQFDSHIARDLKFSTITYGGASVSWLVAIVVALLIFIVVDKGAISMLVPNSSGPCLVLMAFTGVITIIAAGSSGLVQLMIHDVNQIAHGLWSHQLTEKQ